MPAPVQRRPVFLWREGRMTRASEAVLEEVPVALVYNGISHAVMLATPQHLEDFALGFGLGEQIIRRRAELYDLDIAAHPHGVELRMEIASEAMARLKGARRTRTGTTGCGLCGMESLAAFAEAPPRVDGAARVAPAAVQRAMDDLYPLQSLHRATGGAHAASKAGWDGQIRLVREDVGRHNALDKLIGALAGAALSTAQGFCVVTSRASVEMVQKAARADMQVLAAVSAPKAVAIRLAEAAGVTLAGFVRAGRQVLYSHPQRLLGPAATG